MQVPAYKNPEFDQYAAEYDVALARGLSVSGENKDYFAGARMVWLSGRLRKLNFRPRTVMDFGCGVGSATPFIRQFLRPARIIGVDVSAKSLEVARKLYGGEDVAFFELGEYEPAGNLDLVFCNGVFHHIPIVERNAAVTYVNSTVRQGGYFSLWENNPWNPGARYVMSRIPFDRDAVMVYPRTARRMLRAGGFRVVQNHFLFLFPRALSWLRWLEPILARLPLGAQYHMLCRKD